MGNAAQAWKACLTRHTKAVACWRADQTSPAKRVALHTTGIAALGGQFLRPKIDDGAALALTLADAGLTCPVTTRASAKGTSNRLAQAALCRLLAVWWRSQANKHALIRPGRVGTLALQDVVVAAEGTSWLEAGWAAMLLRLIIGRPFTQWPVPHAHTTSNNGHVIYEPCGPAFSSDRQGHTGPHWAWKAWEGRGRGSAGGDPVFPPPEDIAWLWHQGHRPHPAWR